MQGKVIFRSDANQEVTSCQGAYITLPTSTDGQKVFSMQTMETQGRELHLAIELHK